MRRATELEESLAPAWPGPPPTRRSIGLRRPVTLQALSGLAALLAGATAAASAGCYWFASAVVGLAMTDPAFGLWGQLLLSSAAFLLTIRIFAWLLAPSPSSEGIGLTRNDAPEFLAFLDRTCRQLGVGRSLEVRIDGEMRVCIAQRFDRLVLRVGLPLLMSVSVGQWTALLARETGHLDLHRRGFARRASRLSDGWQRVLKRIEGDASLLGRLAAMVLMPVGRRYLAAACRLARAEEFEADVWAAQRVGAEPLAAALLTVALKDGYLKEHFLPGILAQAGRLPAPAVLPFQSMAAALAADFDYGSALAGIAAADGESDREPTMQPSLQARLARLGINPQSLGEDAGPALGASLGPAAVWLAAALDRAWWHDHATVWRVCYLTGRAPSQLDTTAQSI